MKRWAGDPQSQPIEEVTVIAYQDNLYTFLAYLKEESTKEVIKINRKENIELYIELCELAKEKFNIQFILKNEDIIEITGMEFKEASQYIKNSY